MHVLYNGLGGQGSVFHSLISNDLGVKQAAAFYGFGDLRPEYRQWCNDAHAPYVFVAKTSTIDLRGLRRLVHWIEDCDPSVVLLHSLQPLPLIRLRRMLQYRRWRRPPVVVAVEHTSIAAKSARDWVLTGAATLLADEVVTLSSWHEQALQVRFPWTRYRNVRVIPNGVDTDAYSPLETPAHEVEGRAIRIGSITRLEPSKDHVSGIRALDLLVKQGRSVTMLIAGDGSNRHELEHIVGELGLTSHVRFLGDLTRDEVIETLRSLDIFLHLSVGETVSVAVLQAMATGLPVVATHAEGLDKTIIPGTTGVLVPPKDPEAIAIALDELASDPEMRQRLGGEGRAAVEKRFSERRMLLDYRSLIAELI